MNTCDYFYDFLINLLAGILGILIVLWIERQRKPKLTISIGIPGEIIENDLLNRLPCKWLHAHVSNRNVPRMLSWFYQGEPALDCRAWIEFLYSDRKKVFENNMVVRWSGSEEPKIECINTKSGQAFRLIGAQNSFDIPPGESTDIDVVFRFKAETNCYGWNNESYLYEWKHPNWVLGTGRFIARVKIKTGGHEFKKEFLIVNDGPFQEFRLEETHSG
jgi:hypothetical protein